MAMVMSFYAVVFGYRLASFLFVCWKVIKDLYKKNKNLYKS